MDGVELARQIAAKLHTEAVERGADPWQPYAFAVAEAERRGLDVEPSSPGAAVLDGGRAVFISRDRLILHENKGTSFDQAFLVAHEIGHVELGDDDGPVPARDIDPARPAEAAPVGFERVVDYGRRQRREIQMDLFAREFLLPRTVARRLHIDESMPAGIIARRLGASFEVVAQQLLDALLLPPAPLSSDAGRSERPLNAEQRSAADWRGGAYLLEAGPGSGKTQTLTARVQGLLADGVDPRRILVLTFSNKAAGEMADRIAHKRKEAAAAMWVGTFHAFGLDVIRRFHAELGLARDPRLMDRTEAADLLEAEFPRLGLTHYRNIYDPTHVIADMLTAISRAKDEVVDEQRYAELAESMRRSAKTAEAVEAAGRAAEVAKVYERYEQVKRAAHCVDFGDLVALPVRLLEGRPDIRRHFQDQYDHVLVDEYQDVNRGSVRLLAALRPDGGNLWVVGDGKQSIYRFRGASSFNMDRFGKDDVPGGRRGRLKVNYRSCHEIVDAFSHFARGMKAGGEESRLFAERGNGGAAPEHRTVTEAREQVAAIVDAIEEMRRAGYAYRDQAVLCSGNEKLANLGRELEELGIPVLFLGSLFERAEVKDLLALLSLLTDRRAMGLVRVACMRDFAMSLGDVGAVIDHLRLNETRPLAWLNAIDAIPGLSEAGGAALRRLAGALSGFEAGAPPWTVLATLLLDRTRIAARLAASTDVIDRGRAIAIWQFLNFARVQLPGRGTPITRLLDRVRRLVRLADERDLRQLPAAAQDIDAVRLMTIHGAKGLEFPVVHLPGMNADTLPRTPSAPACPPPDGLVEGGQRRAVDAWREGQAEEQECLFYVALSRARDRLFIYSPTRKANGHDRPASPFLDRLGAGLVRRNVVPGRLPPAAPEDQPIDWRCDGKLSFTAPQMALYESCPRRFFYTHVIQVGGRRMETDFMRMHEAVRTVVQSIIEGRVPRGDLEARIAAACGAQELAGQGYAAEFRAMAAAMILFFIGTREGLAAEEPVALRLDFGDQEITVRPDDVLVRGDGRRILRRVWTGHRRSSEADDADTAAFFLAARQAFPDAGVELVHLADQETTPVDLSPRTLDARRTKLARLLADIRCGCFPARPSAWTCPGCPAFFICGPTPPGFLCKKC
jgi:superfamily I DNA/RNA helicase